MLGPDSSCLLSADRPVPDDQPLPHHAQPQVVAVQALRTLIQVQDED